MIIGRKSIEEESVRCAKEKLEQSRKLYELQKEIDELRGQMESIRAEHAQEVARLRELGEQLTDGIADMIDAIGALEAAHTCDGSDGDDVHVWIDGREKP